MDDTTHFRHRDIPIEGGSVHVSEIGDAAADPVVLLHGWPECADAWLGVMRAGAPTHRMIALDLPGIGRSVLDRPQGGKTALAAMVREVIVQLGLADDRLALVGQDAGGMVLFAYLRTQPAPCRAVIMNTAVPGVPPWDEVVANPWIWHFAFHSIPELPETLVTGRESEYFDFFWGAISAHPERITPALRADHVAANGRPDALTQGFALYRAFREDAAENTAPHTIETPLLYVRGSAEGGDIDAYAEGFRAAGVRDVAATRIEDAGHYAPEEQPERVWEAIARHLGDRPPDA